MIPTLRQQAIALAIIAPITTSGAVAEVCAQNGSHTAAIIADVLKVITLGGVVWAASTPQRPCHPRLRDQTPKNSN